MRIRTASLTAPLILGLLIIGFLAFTACSPQSSSGSAPTQSQSEPSVSDNKESISSPSTTQPPTEASSPTAPTSPVIVVVAGYINHGPMQPTVRAIKEVLAKYDDKVAVTWIDEATTQGQSYCQEHGITAHMNVIINGTSTYQVDDKTVVFEWFEGQQWTETDLDAVLANLVGK
ncbi:MAG: hypothetical protein WCD72_03015 [Dehalococcoidia bacterium]